MMNVFTRGDDDPPLLGLGDALRADRPSQDPRHVGTIEPAWNLFDLTPEGRRSRIGTNSWSTTNSPARAVRARESISVWHNRTSCRCARTAATSPAASTTTTARPRGFCVLDPRARSALALPRELCELRTDRDRRHVRQGLTRAHTSRGRARRRPGRHRRPARRRRVDRRRGRSGCAARPRRGSHRRAGASGGSASPATVPTTATISDSATARYSAADEHRSDRHPRRGPHRAGSRRSSRRATSREAEVVAVAARDRGRAEAFASKHGIPKVHDSYDALVADPDIDAIYNPLPNGLHAEWTIAALEAGQARAVREAVHREHARRPKRSPRSRRVPASW